MSNAFWDDLFTSAQDLETSEPFLSGLIQRSIFTFGDIGTAIASAVATDCFGSHDFNDWCNVLVSLSDETYGTYGSYRSVAILDLEAIKHKDPSIPTLVHPFLLHKGFKALQAYRFSRLLWQQGRIDAALVLHAGAIKAYNCDIHPSADVGPECVLHPLTSISIGHDASIGADCVLGRGVSIDPAATLQEGVIVGAHVSILGAITIGTHTEITPSAVITSNTDPSSTYSAAPAVHKTQPKVSVRFSRPSASSGTSTPTTAPAARRTSVISDQAAAMRSNYMASVATRRPSLSTTKTSPTSTKVDPNPVFASRGLLQVKAPDLSREDAQQELIRRKQQKEKQVELQRDLERQREERFLGLTAADVDDLHGNKGPDYRHPKTDPETLERVNDLKARRDREREEMRRLIAERRQSVSEGETLVLEQPPEGESEAETEASLRLQGVDDDTLQLFYFYFDKLKDSAMLSGGSMPSKHELLEFVLRGQKVTEDGDGVA